MSPGWLACGLKERKYLFRVGCDGAAHAQSRGLRSGEGSRRWRGVGAGTCPLLRLRPGRGGGWIHFRDALARQQQRPLFTGLPVRLDLAPTPPRAALPAVALARGGPGAAEPGLQEALCSPSSRLPRDGAPDAPPSTCLTAEQDLREAAVRALRESSAPGPHYQGPPRDPYLVPEDYILAFPSKLL